jgi:hypothetical protein
MGSHPANLVLRFLLETCGLVALGYWGYQQTEGPLRYLLALGTPLAAAFIWGTFRVPEDPTQGGKVTVRIPGLLRLALELAFFSAAVWALFSSNQPILASILGVIIAIHYLISYDRISWLVRQ